MPKGFDFLRRRPPLPSGTEEFELEYLRTEGRRRIVYNTHPLEGLDDPAYWSYLFATYEDSRTVMGVLTRDEFRWSTSPACYKPDYLEDEEPQGSVVTLESSNERDQVSQQWYRWVTIRTDSTASLEAGQLAGFLARNVTNDDLRLDIALRHPGSDRHEASYQSIFSGTLREFQNQPNIA